MEVSQEYLVKDLVVKVKEEMFSAINTLSYMSTSAYDMAWLAWVTNSTWNADEVAIQNGLSFMNAYMKKLIAEQNASFPLLCDIFLDRIFHGCGPPICYPLDGDFVRVSLTDQIENLGLAEHFKEEMDTMLSQVFSTYKSKEHKNMEKHGLSQQILKDSLAFRCLRLHGYRVSPKKFCWFLHNKAVMEQMEENHEFYLSSMYNVYRATDVIFKEESELEAAREFSRRILEKGLTGMTNLQDQIKHQLSSPWLARLDHLEHRKYIERDESSRRRGSLVFYNRLSSLSNGRLLQLANENYTLRQLIFRNELKELERWSKGMGLCDMGFAREKTTYCYFAVASTVSLPSQSNVRLAVVKSAILITVADDFFDAKGSRHELETLTTAILRWEGRGLDGHSKTIFNAVQDLVNEISTKYSETQGSDIKGLLQDLWHKTFVAWLKESEWSQNRHIPSMEEYLKVATSSIATQTIVLPASLLMNPPLPLDVLKCPQSEKVTSLLMLLTRLLNDIQSYQREKEEGKPNLVLLCMNENSNLTEEDVIDIIQKTLEEKKKEFIEHVLVDGMSKMPKTCRLLHLFCLKAFQMFYNSSNAFDSPTALLADIKNAIFDPLKLETIAMEENTCPSPTSTRPFGRGRTSLQAHNATLENNIKRYNGRKFLPQRHKEIALLRITRPSLLIGINKPITCISLL